MLDIKFIRENSKLVEETIKKRGVALKLDHLLHIDEQRLDLIKIVDKLRQRLAAFGP